MTIGKVFTLKDYGMLVEDIGIVRPAKSIAMIYKCKSTQ